MHVKLGQSYEELSTGINALFGLCVETHINIDLELVRGVLLP